MGRSLLEHSTMNIGFFCKGGLTIWRASKCYNPVAFYFGYELNLISNKLLQVIYDLKCPAQTYTDTYIIFQTIRPTQSMFLFAFLVKVFWNLFLLIARYKYACEFSGASKFCTFVLFNMVESFISVWPRWSGRKNCTS